MITRSDLALFIAFMVHFMLLVAGFTVLISSPEVLGLGGVTCWASIPLFCISIVSLYGEKLDKRSNLARVVFRFNWWKLAFVLKNRI